MPSTRAITRRGVLSMILVACSLALAGLSAAQDSTGATSPIVIPPPSPNNAGYFSIRPDLRLCASPLCGGYWVSSVNHEQTLCADGSYQNECYVWRIDWESIGLTGGVQAGLVIGRIVDAQFPQFGNLGELKPVRAWRSATGQPPFTSTPTGTWYQLRQLDIACALILAPCYNIMANTLNKPGRQLISRVDLGNVSAAPEDLRAAQQALNGQGLLAVGRLLVEDHPNSPNKGITMVAEDFYLPVRGEKNNARFCRTTTDCTASVYHTPVTSRDDCYCTLCPEPMNKLAARLNEKGYKRHCSDFGYPIRDTDPINHDLLVCPALACIYPGPVACVNNQCVFDKLEPIPLSNDIPQ